MTDLTFVSSSHIYIIIYCHAGILFDCTHIDEGNSDNYGNLINFSKRSLVSTILIEIESHREVKYVPSIFF